MVLKIFICPSHIANWSLGLLESMGHDRHPIRALGSFHCQLIFAYVQQVSSPVEMNNSKTIFRHNSTQSRKIKRWSIYWVMKSSIGNTWVPVKIICILDYCKTKAYSIGVIPSMGLLLFHADVINCWSLGTYLYKEWILRWGKWSMYFEG